MDDSLHIITPDERNPRADAVRNRQLLLDTASRLFYEQGVPSVTMSAIADAAQVGKGTLYRHFADKAALCLALLDSDMHRFQARVFEQLGAPHSIDEKLRWFLGQAATYVIDHADLLNEFSDLNPENSLTNPAHRWWRQTLRGLLVQLPTITDPDFIADTLYVLLEVRTLRYFHKTQGYSLARIINGLHTTLAKLTA